MKIAIAQTSFSLGDFEKNSQRVLDVLKIAKKSDLLIFPEGGLWAYPPKDFLYQKEYFKIQKQKITQIKSKLPEKFVLLLPAFIKKKKLLFNGTYLLEKGKPDRFFSKESLPDQNVFFESRYFQKGEVEKNFFYLKKKKIQILICEDLWHRPSIQKPDLIISLNASPYTKDKQKKRIQKAKEIVKKYQCPFIYLNSIGAQDSLIFDGGSFALNQKMEFLWQAKFFKPDFKILNIFSKKSSNKNQKQKKNLERQIEQALILGIKTFFSQTGFSKAHLGLSGGIDSALTAYLAVKALGRKNIKAFFLPGPYTQKLSYKLSKQLAKNLKIQLIEKNINSLYHTFLTSFFKEKPSPKSLTAQNLQARIRSLFLMAISNQECSLLLSTSNKSEMAMGYTTLYGDMAGALSPIGDLFKTEIYKLASYINTKQSIFPKTLLKRAPSAELAPDQKDEEDLPNYKNLDKILKKILENKNLISLKERQLKYRFESQEFKRRQAPLILKLSEKDLGEAHKKPIAHKFPC